MDQEDLTELDSKNKRNHDGRSRRSSSSPRNDDPPNTIHTVLLFDVPIVALSIDRRLRLCLAQISSTLLKQFSYNEIHNRRVALGINCVQCTPVQLEILRRAGAMPISSRRCGMITKRESERLVTSFLCETKPPALPDDFAFDVEHACSWGCKGKFLPSRYNSSRAKCIQCIHCQQHFSPNKFIFHSHKLPESSFSPANAANFNSWRRHIRLTENKGLSEDLVHAWEDVKAMFNGGSRRRILAPSSSLRKFIRQRATSPIAATQPSKSTSSIIRQASPHSAAVPAPLIPPPHALINYTPFIHPAASFFHYDWLYRHQHQQQTNLWMQSVQGMQDMWPWSSTAAGGILHQERRDDMALVPYRPAHDLKRELRNHDNDLH